MLPSLDDRVFQLLFDAKRGGLATAAMVFSAMGGGWAMLAIVPFAVRKESRRFALWLTGTLAATAVVVALMKLAVGRDRPYLAHRPLERVLLDSPTDHSFPSGHAAGSFAFALFLAHVLLDRRPRRPHALPLAILGVVLAACVGVSRVVLGFHFPGDVLAGAVLGSVAGGVAGRRFMAGS